MRPVVPVLIFAAVSAAACTPLRGHQGYIVDVDLVNSVQPGVDTRATVQQTLGRPTVAGQFSDADWYYVARDTRNYAYNNPKPVSQITLRVRFDAAGNVASVDRMGVEQVASINPESKKTPTLGRERGFFSDLFGNIGTVGAAGAPTGGGNGP
ncbi:outer membrane protein assembly factor BamE [Sphingomonas donggukensis]|uniref:Outer membrane protein assembly factor BamE n=1 Tax=Sphingomonas donggukensis TaxID=2949093 RepID=A0ABY4TTL8_9SPHN|nr:outer membrane protein assembly factor BamE [Sphingomonas donggukensis]URW75622.1 outer membrane protein assembly factor BamE [Sphingomonas donggukensis]